mmetsp:Transcript_27036/g.58698  ORF Transcript_27036/g.58698 Transcript_27036/m.58698 type:complete len:95 (+) Transcript_27036:216-500(+)
MRYRSGDLIDDKFLDGAFVVPAGSLTFSVLVFSLCAVTCICVLLLRRRLAIFGKAELGGNPTLKVLTAIFFTFLWLLYVMLSALEAYGHIDGDL